MSTHSEWVADGTASTTPVTTSTPVVETTPAVVDTTSVVTPATQSTATVDVTTGTAPAAATPADTVANAEATAKAVQEMITAQLDGKPFQLPKGVQLPWKRGNDSGYVSIEDIQKAHMFERDYRLKTAELAQQRRVASENTAIANARLQAQAKWNEEQAERLQKSFGNPEEEARYTAFLQQYRDDPNFKQIIDEARNGRVMAAERDAVQELRNQELLHTETANIVQAISHLGTQYPEVDPDRVRVIYANQLQLNQADISTAAIEHIFKQESAIAQRAIGPVRSELDSLKAKIAAMESATAATAHNDKTIKGIQRATNPIAAPAGGNAPSPAAPATQLKEKSLRDRGREWARIR